MNNSETATMMMKELSESLNIDQRIQAADNNRLEALKVLTNSILREIESIRQENDVAALDKVNLADEVQRFEIDLIRCALIRTGGKQRQAAKLLNVKITTLNAKIKRYGISLNGLIEDPAES